MRVHGVEERRRKTEQAPGRAAQLLDFLIEVPRTPSGALPSCGVLSRLPVVSLELQAADLLAAPPSN